MLRWVSGCRSLPRGIAFLKFADRLRLVWEFPWFVLDTTRAEPGVPVAAVTAPDTGCPARTAGYLDIWGI